MKTLHLTILMAAAAVALPLIILRDIHQALNDMDVSPPISEEDRPSWKQRKELEQGLRDRSKQRDDFQPDGRIARARPVSQITTINWAAFNGADPMTTMQVTRSPKGTRVPLFCSPDQASQMMQNHYGFTIDYTGVVYDRAGNPIPESMIHAGYANQRAAAQLSSTISALNNEFLTITTESAAYSDQVHDRVFAQWSDAMLNLGRFAYDGYEYEVNNQYTYAVGPDRILYYAENEGHFNSNYHVVRFR